MFRCKAIIVYIFWVKVYLKQYCQTVRGGHYLGSISELVKARGL